MCVCAYVYIYTAIYMCVFFRIIEWPELKRTIIIIQFLETQAYSMENKHKHNKHDAAIKPAKL